MNEYERLYKRWQELVSLNEWKKEDDAEYPSRKKRKKDKQMLKPNNNASSWNYGKEEMDDLVRGNILPEEELINDEIDSDDARYLRGIISTELEAALHKARSGSGCSFNDLVRAMQIWASAEKGNLK
jgi:hypothetical protein